MKKHDEDVNNKEKDIHNDSNAPKSNKKRVMWIVITLVVILGVILLIGFGYFWQKFNKMNQTEVLPDEIDKNQLSQEKEENMEAYTNIALFGIDNRSNGTYSTGNSDTIMIACINNKTYEVKLVSVYRDTYLKVRDDYYGKANAAYAYDGAAGGLSMLNTNFDLDLSKYIAVDWYALVDAINLLGGVEIEITEEERKKINEYIPEVEQVTGIRTNRVTESGQVTLDGVQATAYVRIRKLAGNDYKRTLRQRLVIEAMLKKVKTADLTTLNAMLDQIFPMIETNLKTKDILAMAVHVMRYEISSTTGFPFDKNIATLSSAGDCVVPITLESNVIKLHKYLFGEGEDKVSSEVHEISEYIIARTGFNIDSYKDTESYITQSHSSEADTMEN